MSIALTIFFIALFFGIAQYLSPIYEEDFDNSKSFAELEKKYRKSDWWAILYLFTFVPLLTILLGWIFQRIAQVRNILFFMDYERICSPEFAAWCVLGLAWAFYLLFPFFHWFSQKVLKINLTEYYQYSDLRYGFDNRVVGKWLGTFLLAIALLATPIFFNTYTIFYPQRILVNQYTTLKAKDYQYAQIEALLKVNFFQAPNGDIKNSPKYIILWKEGNDWNPNWNGLPDLADQALLFDFLSKKTGKTIIEVELIEDYLPH